MTYKNILRTINETFNEKMSKRRTIKLAKFSLVGLIQEKYYRPHTASKDARNPFHGRFHA